MKMRSTFFTSAFGKHHKYKHEGKNVKKQKNKTKKGHCRLQILFQILAQEASDPKNDKFVQTIWDSTGLLTWGMPV